MRDKSLDNLKIELQRRGLCMSSRGEGRAAFLFIEHGGKAVEISDHAGRWWVEYWDASEDEDAAPVKDEFFSSEEHVIDATVGWLLHQARAEAV
jgi:hypothetical protein